MQLTVGYDPRTGYWVAKKGDDVYFQVTPGAVGFFGVSTAQAAHIADGSAGDSHTALNAVLVALENVGILAKS